MNNINRYILELNPQLLFEQIACVFKMDFLNSLVITWLWRGKEIWNCAFKKRKTFAARVIKVKSELRAVSVSCHTTLRLSLLVYIFGLDII